MDLNLGWEIDVAIRKLGIDIAKSALLVHGSGHSIPPSQTYLESGGLESISHFPESDGVSAITL